MQNSLLIFQKPNRVGQKKVVKEWFSIKSTGTKAHSPVLFWGDEVMQLSVLKFLSEFKIWGSSRIVDDELWFLLRFFFVLCLLKYLEKYFYIKNTF